MRALITGIDGFTGGYLAAELRDAGHEVHGLSDAPSPLPDVVACDIRDAGALREAMDAIRPDIVCHLAAITHVAHEDVDAIYRTNIVGTRNLLAALAAGGHGSHAVLLASSANIYGNAGGDALDESTPPAPANDYAVSKLAMEHMARLYADRLPIVVVRPFNYTGVGQGESFLLPKIVGHFKRRAPLLELGNLDVVRDFSDVRTVARCYRRLLELGVHGGPFNICSGRGHSLSEVLDMVGEMAGHRPEIRVNPKFVRGNEVRRLIGSRAALERAIGPVEDVALRDTLGWMLREAPGQARAARVA